MGILKKGTVVGSSDKVDTLIGKDTSIKGSITAKGIIRVDGRIEGDLTTQGSVIIGESGKVLADIKARSAVVAGYLEGNIEAEERLEIHNTGTLTGNVKTKILAIDDGATFSGNSDMHLKEQPKGKKENKDK